MTRPSSLPSDRLHRRGPAAAGRGPRRRRLPAARPTGPTGQSRVAIGKELRRVEGFDAQIVEALRPYVTVYPFAGGGGINRTRLPPRDGPAFFDDEVELRLATRTTIRST